MFLFQLVKHIIETEIEIYDILLIWWVDPKYPWSQGIGSPIWGSSMTRVKAAKGKAFSSWKCPDDGANTQLVGHLIGYSTVSLYVGYQNHHETRGTLVL